MQEFDKYASPLDVVNDMTLTLSQKMQVLDAWEKALQNGTSPVRTTDLALDEFLGEIEDARDQLNLWDNVDPADPAGERGLGEL